MQAPRGTAGSGDPARSSVCRLGKSIERTSGSGEGPSNASRPLTKELSNPTRCHIDSNAMLRLKTAPPFAGLLLPRCVMLF